MTDLSSKKIHGRTETLQLSPISVGFWRLDEDSSSTAELQKRVETCMELGMTTMDHADIYGGYTCEAIFGKVLKSSPHLRDSMQIVSKCGIQLMTDNRPKHSVKHYDTSSEHISASVDRSLQNLGTDYLDLLLIHRPDPFMNAGETGSTLDALIQSGKIKNAGVSNFNKSQFDLLQAHMNHPLQTNQIEFSPLCTAPLFDGSFDHAQSIQMPLMAWSPLGGGKLFDENDKSTRELRECLAKISTEKECTVAQLALAWIMAHPHPVIPVLGSNKTERLQEMAGSAAIKVERQEWFTIWQAANGTEVP